jgi:spermidine synthase
MKNRFIYFTVFISGMTALAVEMSASRLIGNVYGSSNLVWASVIGLILIYLSLGYWLGGKLADKHPNYDCFYEIIIWASLAIAIVPMASRPILKITANAFDRYQISILAGSLATILVLFVILVTLLGMVSPFALKLALRDTNAAGKTAGMLSALSTLGSFVGAFLPVLVLIPLIGTYRTFLFFSSVLMLVSTIGLIKYAGLKHWLKFSWMPVLLVFLWIFGVRGADKATENLIYETESSYNYIQVIESEGFRYLRLNDGQGMHSVYHPTQLNYYGPWSQVLVAPYFNDFPHSPKAVERMAIVGMAAGTTARQAASVYGDVLIDGFEIDPKIVDIGKKYFEMNQPNLNVFVEDGRWGLAHSPHQYDIISVDAYRPPYIPWHMTTIEFFEIVHDHLTNDGVMVINIGRSPLDRVLVNDLGTTIEQIFPTTFVMDIPESFNTIVFATKQPGSWENFRKNYNLMIDSSFSPLLIDAMTMTYANQAAPVETTQVYTDDRAPIEWLTNEIVLDFIFSGGTKELQ